MNFNAPILVIVPPRTAAGSRSDPRLGLGVIYDDFGEAALLMHRTRQQVWYWLIGHNACFLCLSVDRSPAKRSYGAGRPSRRRGPAHFANHRQEVSQGWAFEAVATWLSANAAGDNYLGNPPIFKAMVFGIRLSIGTIGEQADNLAAARLSWASQTTAREACPHWSSAERRWIKAD
jgi:hypothetical protein